MESEVRNETHDVVTIEVPDSDGAVELIDRLRLLHAEIAPASGDRCEVQVELGLHPDEAVRAVLRALDEWAARRPRARVRLRVDGRAYSWSTRPPAPW